VSSPFSESLFKALLLILRSLIGSLYATNKICAQPRRLIIVGRKGRRKFSHREPSSRSSCFSPSRLKFFNRKWSASVSKWMVSERSRSVNHSLTRTLPLTISSRWVYVWAAKWAKSALGGLAAKGAGPTNANLSGSTGFAYLSKLRRDSVGAESIGPQAGD